MRVWRPFVRCRDEIGECDSFPARGTVSARADALRGPAAVVTPLASGLSLAAFAAFVDGVVAAVAGKRGLGGGGRGGCAPPGGPPGGHGAAQATGGAGGRPPAH